MRLISAALVLALAVAVMARRSIPAPRLLNVQINRCPTPEIYTNENEEEHIDGSEGKTAINSDFEETLRFTANESGTIQFFVVGRGNFSVEVQSDDSVFEGLKGRIHVDSRQGGAVVSMPFKVVNGVRETSINVTLRTRTVVKQTTIFASTKSLEPPRPPSAQISMVFTPEEIRILEQSAPSSSSDADNRDSTASVEISDNTQVTERNGSIPDVVISNATLQNVTFPSVDDVLVGGPSTTVSKTLRLDSISLNRITANKTDVFVSQNNVYHVTIKKLEKGQIMFMVSGDGNKTVTVKSLSEINFPAKVMQVANNYAALGYADGPDYVNEDRILVKLENDLGEKLYFYLTMSRVD